MDEISLALNPPRFVKSRRGKRPIRIARSASPTWPLPSINGRQPVILPPTSIRPGVELAYARVAANDAVDACPPGTAAGTSTHFTPQMVTVHAIDGGEIIFAGRLGHAYAMIIDHGNGLASHYANLKSLCAIRTDLYRPLAQYVRAGDVIAYLGGPAPGEFKRLYFELWESDRRKHFKPIDPRPRLAECKLVQHYDRFTPSPPESQKEAA